MNKGWTKKNKDIFRVNKFKDYGIPDTDALWEERLETRWYTKSIFISHSHKDKRALNYLVNLLKTEVPGITLYVDWKDSSMPKKTSPETAAKLKDRIDGCDKFIFIGTNRSVKSKWCNWEIGYADKTKYKLDKMAILPVSMDDSQYEGYEYLELYPTIARASKQNKTYNESELDKFVVEYTNPEGGYVWKSLKEWITL